MQGVFVMEYDVKKIYRLFDPSPLLSDEIDLYVPLDKVRGSSGLVTKLSRTVRLSSEKPTCQLLAGHVGSGKSTELQRLKKELETGEEKFFTVVCDILEDIDAQDADFPDILIAMIRSMACDIKERTKIKLKPGYFRQRWDEIKELLGAHIDFKEVEFPFGLGQISAKIKSSPKTRLEIRKHLEPNTNNWIDAANEVIGQAALELTKKGYNGLVIIVDGLDKLPVMKSSWAEQSVAELVFIGRHSQMTAFKCHTVYAIPLGLAYSCRERDIASLYGITAPPVVPMTKVFDEDGKRWTAGFSKFKEIITKRIKKAGADEKIFENKGVMDKIVEYSGGQPRLLTTLIRDSIIEGGLPITPRAVNDVARKITHSYERQLREEHWKIIKEVKKSHSLNRTEQNDYLCMELLANCSILQYINKKEWYGLNPLLPQRSAKK
jgi:hypothetical protein